MFFGKLKLFLFIIILPICIFLQDIDSIVNYHIKSSGFSQYHFNFKKDFAKNDTFNFPLADFILNNPIDIFKAKEIFDSIVNYEEFQYTQNSIAELIEVFYKDIENVLKKNIKLDFNNSVKLIYVLPMLFYEDSLDYIYKGIIERQFGVTDTFNIEVDSIFNYLYKTDTDFKDIIKYRNAFINKISQMYAEGSLIPIDTILECGRLIVSGVDNDIYTDNYDFIIDLGGDDRYINQCGVIYPYTRRLKFIIDFDGDDNYVSNDSFSLSLSAINGVSFLYDFSGDDTYKMYNFSLASVFIGVSSVIDYKGNDTYTSGVFSQGAAFWGIADLIDNIGNDTYIAAAFAQGFGFVKGTGMLIDSSGNDTYRAGLFFKHKPLLKDDYLSMSQGFGLGIRQRACGGIGILFDYKGNDIYHSSVFGQGTSYWHSIGFLFDMKGNDYYSSAEYAQGAGIHLSVGGLFDYNGDDMYYSRYGPSQGEGHDFSVGALVDYNGDDNYTVSGGRGVGLNNSVSFFIDIRGKDNYYGYEKYQNGNVNLARNFYGMGVFLDLAENDFYANNDSNNTIKNYYGIFVNDTVSYEQDYPDTFEIKTDSIEKIFELASIWEVREIKPLVLKARKLLVEKHERAFEYILDEKLNTKAGLELRAIEYFFKNAPDKYADSLIVLLKNNNDKQWLFNVIYVLGKVNKNSAFNVLSKLAHNNDENISRVSIYAIGLLDSVGELDFLKSLYKKSKNYRNKIEIINTLKKHKINFSHFFVKQKENYPLTYTIADYLASFEENYKYLLNMNYNNYDNLIFLDKFIEKFPHMIDSLNIVKEKLKNITDDKINIKGVIEKINKKL